MVAFATTGKARDRWRGGYHEGDPLEPVGPSVYSIHLGMGHISVLHAVWRLAIRPYVDPRRTVLEIGPGRGAWSRAILACNPRHLHVADVLSAEHNGFWAYVGEDEKRRVTYHEVRDTSLSEIPDGSIDHVFSFGTFCHLSPQLQAEYFRTFARVMKAGAHGFVMYGDYDKFNAAMAEGEKLSLRHAFGNRRALPIRIAYDVWSRLLGMVKHRQIKDEGPVPRPGRWWHVGRDEMRAMIEGAGLRVVNPDVDVVFRDPLVHFAKP